jgi:hypothetical protein
MANVTSLKNRSDDQGTKSRPKTYIDANTLAPSPSHEQIRAIAYELWCERGGSELENWLEAEQRLQQRSGSSRPRSQR